MDMLLVRVTVATSKRLISTSADDKSFNCITLEVGYLGNPFKLEVPDFMLVTGSGVVSKHHLWHSVRSMVM